MSRIARLAVLQQILDLRLVPTVWASAEDIYQRVAEALFEGGVPIIEVLQRAPGDTIPKTNLDAIYRLRKAGDMLVGCGTVHTREQAQVAINQGAQFVVSNTF